MFSISSIFVQLMTSVNPALYYGIIVIALEQNKVIIKTLTKLKTKQYHKTYFKSNKTINTLSPLLQSKAIFKHN